MDDPLVGLAVVALVGAAFFGALGARTPPDRVYKLSRGGMMRTRTALLACAAICAVTAVAALLARPAVP